MRVRGLPGFFSRGHGGLASWITSFGARGGFCARNFGSRYAFSNYWALDMGKHYPILILEGKSTSLGKFQSAGLEDSISSCFGFKGLTM